MLEEVERLSRLVDGLLLLSRAESGQIPLRMHSVDLGELVQSVTGLLGILASEKKQDLLLEIAEPASVHIDPMLVSQAVTNVLDNSIRYTPVNGTIRLRMGLLNKKAAFLDIIDSGPGIPPWARERVFEHFYRLPSKEKTPGTGLGLAIAHWVMKVNGGGIEFLEPEKPGAWCRITLPLATEPNPR
jgi:signal transduction histidine kinase